MSNFMIDGSTKPQIFAEKMNILRKFLTIFGLSIRCFDVNQKTQFLHERLQRPFPVRYDHCVLSLIFLHLHAFFSLGLMQRLLASEDALSLWRREAENTAVFEGYEDPCFMIHGCARLDHGSRKLLAPEL